jgi:hypothetical protein
MEECPGHRAGIKGDNDCLSDKFHTAWLNGIIIVDERDPMQSQVVAVGQSC